MAEYLGHKGPNFFGAWIAEGYVATPDHWFRKTRPNNEPDFRIIRIPNGNKGAGIQPWFRAFPESAALPRRGPALYHGPDGIHEIELTSGGSAAFIGFNRDGPRRRLNVRGDSGSVVTQDGTIVAMAVSDSASLMRIDEKIAKFARAYAALGDHDRDGRVVLPWDMNSLIRDLYVNVPVRIRTFFQRLQETLKNSDNSPDASNQQQHPH